VNQCRDGIVCPGKAQFVQGEQREVRLPAEGGRADFATAQGDVTLV
jgi:glucokinase